MFNIYHHNDFDGLASAALFSSFLTWKDGLSLKDINFISVDYDIKDSWGDYELATPCAVLDFLYHYQAEWWFDHHDSTFTNRASVSLPYQHSNKKYWNTKFLSCPSLFMAHAYIHFRKFYFILRNEYLELIKWSNIIDGAKYEKIEDLFSFTNVYININKTLAVDSSGNYHKMIIKGLYENDLSLIENNNNYKNNIEKIKEKEAHAKDLIENIISIEHNIAYFDQSAYDLPFQRYLAYYIFPNIKYRVAIFKKGTKYSVSVNYNNWLQEQNKINLGEICRKLGGGGRKNVGGVITDTHEDATKTAQTIKKSLLFHLNTKQLNLFESQK